MIPTNPELIETISAHENLAWVRLDIEKNAAYLISEGGHKLEMRCSDPVELHQLGSLIKMMTEGKNVDVYWGNGTDQDKTIKHF